MTGLLDIGPLTKDVTIAGGAKVTVKGLSADNLFLLLREFPEIRGMMESKAITPQRAMQMTPKALATLIACGTGEELNPKAIQKAAELVIGDQAILVHEIFQLTFPEGIGPFVERFRHLRKIMETGVTGSKKEQDTNSRGSVGASVFLDMDGIAPGKLPPVNLPH